MVKNVKIIKAEFFVDQKGKNNTYVNKKNTTQSYCMPPLPLNMSMMKLLSDDMYV